MARGLPGGRRAAVPHGHHGDEPVHPRHGHAAGAGARRHRRRSRAHRALLPDRARSIARARGQARHHDRRELAAVRPASRRLGRHQGRAGRRRDRADRRRLPEAPGPDRAPSGAEPARPRAADRPHGRARVARRHVARSAAVHASGARLRRLPDADRRVCISAARARIREAASPGRTDATRLARCSAMRTRSCHRFEFGEGGGPWEGTEMARADARRSTAGSSCGWACSAPWPPREGSAWSATWRRERRPRTCRRGSCRSGRWRPVWCRRAPSSLCSRASRTRR